MTTPAQTRPERWEYTLVDTVISAYRDPNNQVGEWLDNLNKLGEEGWETVTDTVIHGKGYSQAQWPVLLMKRRKDQPATGDALAERAGLREDGARWSTGG